MTNEEVIEFLLDLKDPGMFPVSAEEYQAAVKIAVSAVNKQTPKKPYQDNENGEYEDDFCPTCHRKLFPHEHHCRCGQAIDWSGLYDE